MFFAPPEVKSLSRYAEFGSHDSGRLFLTMLAVAIAVHLSVIGIYSLKPHEKILKIPVRVMNIKLSGGSSASLHMPVPSSMPGLNAQAPEPASSKDDEAMDPLRESSAESAIDKALTPKSAPGTLKSPVIKMLRTPKQNTHNFTHSFATPKKYVRESDLVVAKTKDKTGNGSDINGTTGGQEMISRYTQVVSQWIINHQAFAKAACAEARAVTGACNASGQAVVRLRINRDGQILGNTIEHTSGNELVDQAALIMVHASDPVPPVPGDYPSDSQLEFLIAVQVNLAAK